MLDRLASGRAGVRSLVALGEMGLDFSHKNKVDTECQKEVRDVQLDIGKTSQASACTRFTEYDTVYFCKPLNEQRFCGNKRIPVCKN